METFLQILGIIFLAFLCVIGLVILWIVWKVWGWWRQFQVLTKSMGALAAGAVPPFRVKLTKVDRPTWADRDQIEFLAGPLRKAGFVDLGIFDVTPSLFRLLALASTKDNIYAAVYQHPESGVHLDLVTAYQDGTFCTYSTSKQAGLLDQPQFKTTKSLPEFRAAELLKRFLAERPQQAMLPATAEDFPHLFESFWARDFDWRIARGGVSDAEIRRVAALDGSEISDEAAQMIKLQWRGAIRAFYDEQLQQSYLATGNVSAQEWEKVRDRVRFVHDKLDWDSLMASCGVHPDGCEETEDPKQRTIQTEAERLAAALPPREAFARINDLLPEDRRAKKVAEVTQPITADVYLSPKLREPSIYDEDAV
jgi:hypothetical protein